MSKLCVQRLTQELRSILSDPIPGIFTYPLEDDVKVWHFCICGPEDSPYEGGFYHGVMDFPSEFPLKAPSIRFRTPNGRFGTGINICMSMTSYHEATFNPTWGPRKCDTKLLPSLSASTYKLEDNSDHIGAVHLSTRERQKLAKSSLANNRKDKLFVKLFDEDVEMFLKEQMEMRKEKKKRKETEEEKEVEEEKKGEKEKEEIENEKEVEEKGRPTEEEQEVVEVAKEATAEQKEVKEEKKKKKAPLKKVTKPKSAVSKSGNGTRLAVGGKKKEVKPSPKSKK